MRNVDLVTSNRYNLCGGDNLQVDIKVNPCVEDVEVLITAEKKEASGMIVDSHMPQN